MDVVLFEPKHLKIFPISEEWIGNADVFEDDGEPQAVVGFVDWGDRAEVGLILTEAAKRDPVEVVRQARHYLDGIKHVTHRPGWSSLRCLCATVTAGDRRLEKWMKILGFRYEGPQLDGRDRSVRIYA